MGRTLVFGIGLKEKDNLNKKQELQNAIGYGMFTRGYGEYLSGAAVLGGEVGYTGKVRSKAQSNPKKGRKVSAFDHTEGGARYLEKGVCSECGEPTTIEYMACGRHDLPDGWHRLHRKLVVQSHGQDQ
jgi:hypothetical protein